jgi:hypothetical protein
MTTTIPNSLKVFPNLETPVKLTTLGQFKLTIDAGVN